MTWVELFRRAVGFHRAEDALREGALRAAIKGGNILILQAEAARPPDLFALCYLLDVHAVDVPRAVAQEVFPPGTARRAPGPPDRRPAGERPH